MPKNLYKYSIHYNMFIRGPLVVKKYPSVAKSWKHTLFKVLYFILAKWKNYTLYFYSVKYFKNTLL